MRDTIGAEKSGFHRLFVHENADFIRTGAGTGMAESLSCRALLFGHLLLIYSSPLSSRK
jgi:hypothetical protein